MVKEARPESAVGAIGWVQDQLYEMKAQLAQLQQQLEHLRSASTEMSETQRATEATLHEATQGVSQVPRLQEEINQAAALIVQLQDQQAELNARVAAFTRRRKEEETQDQEDWTGVSRRVTQLERAVEHWQNRQASVDELGGRYQEGVSLLRLQLQKLEQRLEVAETMAARGVEGANRTEHSLTEAEAATLNLQRELEALTERARVTTDVTQRLENTLNQRFQELHRLELLAERIELHRAERQRLEDRALRLEEGLNELRGRAETEEHQQGRLSIQQQGLASRVAALQELVEEQQRSLLEQLRKLTSSQERTKRRQIQELEREVREMRKHVAELTAE